MITLTKRQQEQLRKAIRDYAEANFECGEWDRNESDEEWDDVYERSVRARTQIEKILNTTLGPTSSGA